MYVRSTTPSMSAIARRALSTLLLVLSVSVASAQSPADTTSTEDALGQDTLERETLDQQSERHGFADRVLPSPASDPLHITSRPVPRRPCEIDMTAPPPDSLDLSALYDASALRIGSEDAPVKVAQFFDVSCPHCLTYHDHVFKALIAAFDTTDVSYYFYPYPLSRNSVLLLQTLYFADRQGRFPHLLESYYRLQPRALNTTTFQMYAKLAGVSDAQLLKAAQSPSLQRRVRASLTLARDLKVEGTPTVFINQTRVPMRSLNESCLTQTIGSVLSESVSAPPARP